MTYITAPSSIDATGKKDVTVPLSEWMAGLKPQPVKRADGEVVDQRQARLRTDGVYLVRGGLWTPTDIDIDLDGARLWPGEGTGTDVPLPGGNDGPWHKYARPLWPRGRSTVHLEARSHIYSRRTGARIWGGNFEPAWLGAFRPPDKRAWPMGCRYQGQKYEGQHAIRVADDGCVVNLKKTELAFTHGDGVYDEGYVTGTEILGNRNRLAAYEERGATVVAAGGRWPTAPEDWRWKPAAKGTAGIHHIGRQGVAKSGGKDFWMHGVTMYQISRSWVDFEPGARGTLDGALIEDCVAGSFQGNWIASKGNGFVNNVTLRRNLNVHRPLGIYCVEWGTEDMRRKNWVVEDNVAERKAFAGSPLALMRFERVDGVRIAGNKQYIDKRQPGRGTYFDDCTNVDVPGEAKQFLLV